MSQQFHVGQMPVILLWLQHPAGLPTPGRFQAEQRWVWVLCAFTELDISQVEAMTSKPLPAYSQGSRAMKCAPKAGWMLVGFGVAISLLLAIFVLALANSNRKVWGFSGSKRIPCHRREHRSF